MVVDMAPGSNRYLSGPTNMSLIPAAVFFFFSFLHHSCAWDQGFLWASGSNIILHFVGGSRVPKGIISGWDQVQVGSGPGRVTFGSLLLFVCLCFLMTNFPKHLYIYQADKSIGGDFGRPSTYFC